LARIATIAVTVLMFASLASGCGDSGPPADTPDAVDVSAEEFGAMSTPEQSDLVEKFYGDYEGECTNIDLGAAPDDEFMSRIRTSAGGMEGATMAQVLLGFCAPPE
jgi:hypothetical protein